MTPEELECAKSYRDKSFEGGILATVRTGELADQYTTLEAQIAAILLTFGGVFVGTFTDITQKIPGNPLMILFMKLLYASSIILLILSLIMGLIHIKLKEKWWEGFIAHRNYVYDKWVNALSGSITYKEALSHHDGTSLGQKKTAFSPKWTWILQTIFLSVAVAFLLTLFLMFLFKH